MANNGYTHSETSKGSLGQGINHYDAEVTDGRMRMGDCCCTSDAEKTETCCGEVVPPEPKRTIIVELCYLDVTTCERCQGADQQVDTAVEAVRSALAWCECAVMSKKVLIENEAMAEQYRFLSSPTVRVNGIDICNTVEENDCSECSDIAQTDVTCRVFSYKGEKFDVPPVPLIIDTIMRVYLGNLSTDNSQKPYKLPENLAQFFSGKRSGSMPKTCC